jgi:peptidoglycan/LPS O-acetylase OafA/YrhL
MKKIIDFLITGVSITLLLCIVVVVGLFLNFILLWMVEKVDFLGISMKSTRAYWEFAVGMLLFFIPSFVTSIFIGVIILRFFREEVCQRKAYLLNLVVGFFLVLGYLYFLDKCINDLSISLYGYLALAFIYCLPSVLLENKQLKEIFKKIREKWRNKRRVKRKENKKW